MPTSLTVFTARWPGATSSCGSCAGADAPSMPASAAARTDDRKARRDAWGTVVSPSGLAWDLPRLHIGFDLLSGWRWRGAAPDGQELPPLDPARLQAGADS
jgi:hypothetical protein